MATANREEKARLLFSSHKYVEAAEEYVQLAQEQPTCAKWLTNEAKCFLYLNQHTVALDLCRKSILVDKAWSRGYEIAAQCLLALQRSQEAAVVLLEGMQAAPSSLIEKLLEKARADLSQEEGGGRTQSGRDQGAHASQGPPGENGHGQKPPGGAVDGARTQRLPQSRGLNDGTRWREARTRVPQQGLEERRNAFRWVFGLESAGRVEEAVSIYEQQAAEGCTAAMSRLAEIFFCGQGVAADPAAGVFWARQCMESGTPPGGRLLGELETSTPQTILGRAYQNGVGGLTRDLAQAERWLRAAAEGGNVGAMVNLADLLEEQGRVPEEQVALLRRAAGLDHLGAMARLGLHLKDGAGCARDPVEAAAWLDKAVQGGELKAFEGLADLARAQPGPEGIRTLEAARRHVKTLRAREEQRGGVQCITLVVDAHLCLDTQRACDRELSQGELLQLLAAAGGAPPLSFAEFLDGRQPSVGLAAKYRDELMERLGRCRAPTKLEREAAQAAEMAGKRVMSPRSSSDAIFSEGILHLLRKLGKLFRAKGMEDEAHVRFLLPAAKMGDAESCHLAGCYLAARATSGKDLRTAQRLLGQAAARDEPGAQGELDALTRRLARGDVLGDVFDNCIGEACDGVSFFFIGDECELDKWDKGNRSVTPGKKTNKGTGSKSAEVQGAPGGSAGERSKAPGGSSKACTDDKVAMVHEAEVAREERVSMDEGLAALLEAVQPSLDADSPLIPGGPPVHLPMLEAYVSSHRGSYTGWGLLYAMRHFEQALRAMVRKDYAAAVSELHQGFLFNDKGLGIPHSFDLRTGEASPAPAFQPLLDYVDQEVLKGQSSAAPQGCGSSISAPSQRKGRSGGTSARQGRAAHIRPSRAPPSSAPSPFFRAAVVKMFTARDSRDRLRCADLALQAAPPRMAPAVMRWRGHIAAVHCDYSHAFADWDAACKLLRADASTSLWPYDPPEFIGSPSSGLSTSPSDEVARFREIMACTLDLDIGRMEVELSRPVNVDYLMGRPTDAVSHLKRFQQGVPEDTDRVCESYAYLWEALTASAQPGKARPVGNKPVDLLGLWQAVERTMDLQVPVFRPIRTDEVPQMRRMASMLRMEVKVTKKDPNIMPPKGASGVQTSTQGKGSQGGPAISENVAVSMQVFSTCREEGAAVKTCWGCEAKAEPLQRCGGTQLVTLLLLRGSQVVVQRPCGRVQSLALQQEAHLILWGVKVLGRPPHNRLNPRFEWRPSRTLRR
eukprot:jgi/Mesvir1/13874/Mv16014-RA.3